MAFPHIDGHNCLFKRGATARGSEVKNSAANKPKIQPSQRCSELSNFCVSYFTFLRNASTPALNVSGSDQWDMWRLITKTSECGMLVLIQAVAFGASSSLTMFKVGILPSSCLGLAGMVFARNQPASHSTQTQARMNRSALAPGTPGAPIRRHTTS